MPVLVTKAGNQSFVPQPSWQGTFEDGTYIGGGDVWPGRQQGFYMEPDSRFATIYANAWYGSIIDRGVESSGLIYLRYRYYDPGSGQFTQQDPIGLAGGLNVNGFAGGDPVVSDSIDGTPLGQV